MDKKVFQKYYSRLKKEGIIKALVCGAAMGLAASIIPSVIALAVNYNGVWISLAVGLAAGAAATWLFYSVIFRPNTKQIAERVDRLGLDERLITMLELEKDESYIAMRQREDAKERLSSVDHNRIKISLFKIPLVLLALVFACSVTMMTVSALSVDAMIPDNSKDSRQTPVEESYTYFQVRYFVVADLQGNMGGYIDKNADQIVAKGEDAATVTAIPYPGYVFAGWSDRLNTAVRTDKNIKFDSIFVAYFTKPSQTQSGEDGSGGETNPGEETEEKKSGGQYEEINNIIRNDQYYRDLYQEYYDQAMIDIAEGKDISPEYRKIIEFYYGIII